MLAARPEIDSVSERGRIRWVKWFRREVVSRTRAGEGLARVFLPRAWVGAGDDRAQAHRTVHGPMAE